MNWKHLSLILILVVPVFGNVTYDDFEPSVTNTWSLGSETYQWKDAWGDGTLDWDTITDGTFSVTGGVISAGTWQGSKVAVPYGGTDATTLTDGGILLGSGTSAITALGVASNGQIPIGDGTTDPVLATITGSTGITVTNGAGSITLDVNDTGVDHGGLTGLGDVNDHLLYLDLAGTRNLTADWDAGNYDIKALSFSIGANKLTTSEWAYLDGQDQAVKIASLVEFAKVTVESIVIDDDTITNSNALVISTTNTEDLDVTASDDLNLTASDDLNLTASDDVVIAADDEINLKAGGDTDDFIDISTSSNQTNLRFEGQNGLITAAGGTISFDDEILTWGGGGSANANTAYTNRVDTWTAPLAFSSNTVSIPVAATDANGYLSQDDWDTFNAKADYSFGANNFSGTGNFTTTGGEFNLVDDTAVFKHGAGGAVTFLTFQSNCLAAGATGAIFASDNFATTLGFILQNGAVGFSSAGQLGFQSTGSASADAVNFISSLGGISLTATTAGKKIYLNSPLVEVNAALQMGDDKLIALDTNAGLTASTMQTQGQGALTAQINEISTVVNKDDTVTLPSAITGVEIEIINNGAMTLQIFPASEDDLGLGPNTPEELEANERVKFVAYTTTNWAKESTTEIIHAEIHDEDNTDAFVINVKTDFHSYHTNGLVAGDLADWAFDAGGAGTSHAITGIADAGGGDVTVTTGGVHGLAVGDIISQTNLADANYVGVFDVLTVPTTTTYTVTATYTATGTGTMDQAATLEADAVAAGVYDFAYYISAVLVGNNETFDFQLYREATAVTGSKIRRKFGASTDFGSMSGGGVVAVNTGDKISFALSNEDSAANIIIRNVTIVLVRL